MALIELRGIKKAFGTKVVYEDLNLDIHAGESLTIIGGSGSGKSVMLKMLIGLLDVDAGTIHFDGRRIDDLRESELVEVRRRIGMLFQGAALFDSMSVRDNIAYPLREHGRPTEEEIDRRVAEALGYVGLSGIEDLWPSSLSGGMKKRVGLARAIVSEPEVLLYDEPTTGLDPINVTRIGRLILRLDRTLEVTSVVVTHDMDTAFTVSDRLAMIHEGRIIFEGTPEQIRASTDPRVRDFIEGNARENEETETLMQVSG